MPDDDLIAYELRDERAFTHTCHTHNGDEDIVRIYALHIHDLRSAL